MAQPDTIHYTPNAGFAGSDAFSAAARNAIGEATS